MSSCTCGREFEPCRRVWFYGERFYCSEGCARFHRESFGNFLRPEEPAPAAYVHCELCLPGDPCKAHSGR